MRPDGFRSCSAKRNGGAVAQRGSAAPAETTTNAPIIHSAPLDVSRTGINSAAVGGMVCDPRQVFALSDGVIVLRPIGLADVDRYVQLQDAEMATRFEWTGRATRETVTDAVSRWVESWRSYGNERNFAILDAVSREMIGDCEIESRPDGYVNVMYVVFAGWRRHGVASRAASLLADYAHETFPGRPLLFRIHPDNVGSIAVAESLGSRRAGSEISPTGRELEWWVVTPPEPAP